MTTTAEDILAVLDRCCDDFTFPMLDNGYFYLAATRLSLYRSPSDWAIVIETFGFSPRGGTPSNHIQTFASRLHDRDPPEQYANRQAHEQYLVNRRNDEFRAVNPLHGTCWIDEETGEFVAEAARTVVVRDRAVSLPGVGEYASHGIELERPPQVHVFELCRYLAAVVREQVLGTPQERRGSILPEMVQILQLEEWHHPDVILNTECPSGSETFRQLAEVLVSGDVRRYHPTHTPNTHWRNWPDGGRL